MDKNLISVIVPVYKAEAYLEACVNSILAQTYTQLEIILVDDGSPDGSGALCDLMAERDTRIRVLHKENGGVSSARNAGLDIAQGEYIAFVDSDDTIDSDMYEKLYMRLKETGADMGVCGYKMLYKDYMRMKRVPVERVYCAEQVWEGYMNAFRSYYTIFSSSWNKLIKKDVVKTHRFPEWLRTAEDGWFIANCVADCHKGIAFVDCMPYNYFIAHNPNSISNRKDSFDNVNKLLAHIATHIKKAFPEKVIEIDNIIKCQVAVNMTVQIHSSIIKKYEKPHKLKWRDVATIQRHSTSNFEKLSSLALYFLPAPLYRAGFKFYCNKFNKNYG